jgi:hypothetical protein
MAGHRHKSDRGAGDRYSGRSYVPVRREYGKRRRGEDGRAPRQRFLDGIRYVNSVPGRGRCELNRVLPWAVEDSPKG